MLYQSFVFSYLGRMCQHNELVDVFVNPLGLSEAVQFALGVSLLVCSYEGWVEMVQVEFIDCHVLDILCIQKVAGEHCRSSFCAIGEEEHDLLHVRVIDVAVHGKIDTAAGYECFQIVDISVERLRSVYSNLPHGMGSRCSSYSCKSSWTSWWIGSSSPW